MTSASNSYEAAADQRRAAGEPPAPEPAASVATGPAQEEGLPQQPPPSTEEGYLLHGRKPAASAARVILHPAAARQIQEHVESDLEREVGGALLGHAYRHEGHTYVEIEAALPAVTSDHGPIHFTFNADAWSQLHRDRALRFPALNIVGWFHTHPGLGVFYSADDVVVHSAAFVMPWHVGLVVDPVRGAAAFFGWKEKEEPGAREIAPLGGFYELLEEGPSSAVPWQAVRAAVWEETYEEHLLQRQEVQEGAQTPSQLGGLLAGLPAISPWLGVGAGLAGLLLSLVILFAAVLPLYRRTATLETMTMALAGETMAAANVSGEASCPDPRLRIFAPLAGHQIPGGGILNVIGTADYPQADLYRVEVRLTDLENWWLLDEFGRDVVAGQLAEWDTHLYTAGEYEVRLMALDDQQQPLPDAEACTIRFDLLEATPAAP